MHFSAYKIDGLNYQHQKTSMAATINGLVALSDEPTIFKNFQNRLHRYYRWTKLLASKNLDGGNYRWSHSPTTKYRTYRKLKQRKELAWMLLAYYDPRTRRLSRVSDRLSLVSNREAANCGINSGQRNNEQGRNSLRCAIVSMCAWQPEANFQFRHREPRN